MVEIVGLPSIGKTSIIESLKKNYKDQINFVGKQKCKRRVKFFEVFKFFLRLIFFYPKIIFDFKSSFWLLSKITLRLCGYRNDIKNEICILNESGALMPIISFIVQWNKSSYKVDLNKIIQALPLPDVVVFIESDIGTVINRYKCRGGVKIHGKQDRYPVVKNVKLYKQFLLGRNVLLNLQDILKKKCTVIVVNNNNVKCDKAASYVLHELILQLNLD